MDRIKIDRSFIRLMRENSGAGAITRTAIALAHDLKLSAVAEGVEGAAEWGVLQELGCDSVQGYYISRPLAPSRGAAVAFDLQRAHLVDRLAR